MNASLSFPFERHPNSAYFGAGAGAGAGTFCVDGSGSSPRTMETAAGGSGLSALATSRVTCQICVSVSVSLKDGMPAFNAMLTETQIWQVTLLLANADKPLPPAAVSIVRGEEPLPSTQNVPAPAPAPAPK